MIDPILVPNCFKFLLHMKATELENLKSKIKTHSKQEKKFKTRMILQNV